MPAISPTTIAPAVLTAAPIVPSVPGSESGAPAVDGFAHLLDTFEDGASDPTARAVPWELYKPDAGSASVTGGALVISPTQGGGGPTGSLIYTASPGAQFDGFMVYVEVGPDAATPTPVGFDVRADITVSNGAGSALPTVAPGEWRFAPLGVWSPGATYFNELHVAGGADPTTVGVEVKSTDVDAGSGESIYPVAPRAGAHPFRAQYRIVRRATAPQLFDVYWRPYTGQALSSNVGWTRLYTIDRSSTPGPADDFPTRPNSVPMPETVWLFLAAYSSALGADVRSTVHEFRVTETTA